MDYVIAGMLLAVGFRMGLFISVFGATRARGVLVSFIQPLIFFFAFMPPSLYHQIVTQSYVGLAFGASLLAIGIIWTFFADRAGRPGVKSTFGLFRAFLVAWSENKVDMIRRINRSKSSQKRYNN